MHLKDLAKVVGTNVVVVALTVGCQTVPENAPHEFHQAQQAIDKADDQDVEDVFPRAVERAERLFAEASELLNQAELRSQEGHSELASTTRTRAIDRAVRARDVATAATDAKTKLPEWDKNPRKFAQLMEEVNRTGRLESELTETKDRNAELQQQQKELQSSVANLRGIPAEFRVAKPVAFFETGKSQIPVRSKEDISELADLMKSYENLTVELAGYTDKRGSAEYNEQLSNQRAQAVKASLTKSGIAADRIKIMAYGKSKAQAEKMAAAGMQLDRKVVAKLAVSEADATAE